MPTPSKPTAEIQLAALRACLKAGVSPIYAEPAGLVVADALATDPATAGSAVLAESIAKGLRATHPAFFAAATQQGQQAAPAVAYSGPNPWRKGADFNITEQGRITRLSPDLAKSLQAQAEAE